MRIKSMILLLFSFIFISFFSLPYLDARIELVTLPAKEGVKLTIYNSEDLTLVKENRILTFKKGLNRLEFSWAGTLIDPTSLIFRAISGEENLDILDVSFPKNIKDTLVWNILCRQEGSYSIELSYFTSGLSWAAKYLFISDAAEKSLNLKLYITLKNNSGEDYLRAKTRLVVGKINLVEKIAQLARSGRSIPRPRAMAPMRRPGKTYAKMKKGYAMRDFERQEPKKIHKEGLSEYFLYTIEGEEDIKNRWGKKVINLKKEAVAFKAFYKYDTERWGSNIRRFFRFKNDKKSLLGEEPLPDGVVVVYSRIKGSDGLKYIGQAHTKYIPIGQKVDLDLGYEQQVTIKKKLTDYRTGAFTFDYRGNIRGWNEYKYYELEIKNRRLADIDLELKEHFNGKWVVEALSGDQPKKDDYRTVKYKLNLEPQEIRKVAFKITQFHGKNAENR
ncbi:DUF4139 domain-containing protein [Candidatus Riflebacteria bacterium]